MDNNFYCPFRDDRCCKDDCALYYEENDTCAIYQIAISVHNIEENYVMELMGRINDEKMKR